jgi:hypothetical protein
VDGIVTGRARCSCLNISRYCGGRRSRQPYMTWRQSPRGRDARARADGPCAHASSSLYDTIAIQHPLLLTLLHLATTVATPPTHTQINASIFDQQYLQTHRTRHHYRSRLRYLARWYQWPTRRSRGANSRDHLCLPSSRQNSSGSSRMKSFCRRRLYWTACPWKRSIRCVGRVSTSSSK